MDFPTSLRALNEDMRGKAGVYVLTIVGRDGTRWALRTMDAPNAALPDTLQEPRMKRRYLPEIRLVGEIPTSMKDPAHA